MAGLTKFDFKFAFISLPFVLPYASEASQFGVTHSGPDQKQPETNTIRANAKKKTRYN